MSVTIFSNCTKTSILILWTCDKHHTHKKPYKTTWNPNYYLRHKTVEIVKGQYSCNGILKPWKEDSGADTKVPDISPFLPIHVWTLHHFWPMATSLYCLLTVKITTNIQVKISSLEQIWTASNHETSFHSLSKPVTQIISIVILWSYATSSNWTQRLRVSWSQHMNTFCSILV